MNELCIYALHVYVKVTVMDNLQFGRCLLVNYTTPAKKGASISLYFENPSPDLVEFAAQFIDEVDLPAAALDRLFTRFTNIHRH